MKVLFQNTTKYTKEAYSQFLVFHNDRFGFKYHAYTLFITIMLAFCFTLHVKYSNSIYAAIFLLAIILFLIWRIFHPAITVRKEYKSKQIEEEFDFTFKFYENHFEVHFNKDYYKVRYYKIRKVFENVDYLYIYVNADHAFLLNKENFSIGNSKDFVEFIKKKCPLKYRK